MGSEGRSRHSRRARVGITLAVAALALVAPSAAHAQFGVFGRLAGFLVPGGYFFTSDGTRTALNDSLWYHEADLIRYSVGIGVAGTAFSLKAINASSGIVPYNGATQYSLYGPSVFVWTAALGRIHPFASAGFFAGNVKSDRLGINKWDFTPSLSAGVDIPFTRVVTMRAEYRISEELAGLNTNGVVLRLSLF